MKVSKKKKRRIFLLEILFVCIFCFLSYNFIITLVNIVDKKMEKKDLEEQLVELEEKKESLNVEYEKLQDPDYVARYAREKYLYSKDGEILIRIP